MLSTVSFSLSIESNATLLQYSTALALTNSARLTGCSLSHVRPGPNGQAVLSTNVRLTPLHDALSTSQIDDLLTKQLTVAEIQGAKGFGVKGPGPIDVQVFGPDVIDPKTITVLPISATTGYVSFNGSRPKCDRNYTVLWKKPEDTIPRGSKSITCNRGFGGKRNCMTILAPRAAGVKAIRLHETSRRSMKPTRESGTHRTCETLLTGLDPNSQYQFSVMTSKPDEKAGLQSDWSSAQVATKSDPSTAFFRQRRNHAALGQGELRIDITIGASAIAEKPLLDSCLGLACYHNASCSSLSATGACVCRGTYTGPFCETKRNMTRYRDPADTRLLAHVADVMSVRLADLFYKDW
ncbi:unnamed protein product [Protopolystoma xenopodis]|uniref:EGF-like domain-containing protein n=1 Tax=Protopolystoma xenopodis TaxID=117903 RepID=A0A448XB23_9PLAT|nr:unnamed protein product [Protopolystoma xenopodis]